MLARASFFPTLAYNVLMERVTARNWWDRVDSQVVLGAIPFKGEAHKLVCRISHVFLMIRPGNVAYLESIFKLRPCPFIIEMSCSLCFSTFSTNKWKIYRFWHNSTQILNELKKTKTTPHTTT